jgi:hypothetical protein
MSNKIVNNGKVFTGNLFGAEGEIKEINVIKDIPKTASDARSRVEDVPLDKIRSYGNRDTELKNIKKILKQAGGINGNLFQEPRVARIPLAETGEYEYLLWDGDHSKAIFTNLYPGARTMPCKVVEVKSMKEVHDLFVQSNAKCRTSITSEQIFVNAVLAGEHEAIKNKQKLAKAGLYVYCSSEEGGRQGNIDGLKVKINGAKRCFKVSGNEECDVETYVKPAVELIAEMNHFEPAELMPAELLEALTMIYVSYIKLRESGINHQKFKKWFLDSSKQKTVKAFATSLKKQGGDKVNHAALSIAKGVISEMRQSPTFADVTAGQLNRKFARKKKK